MPDQPVIARAVKLAASGTALAGIAALACLSGFDRAAATNPGLTSLVPSWFGANSAIAQGQLMLREQHPDEVLALAERAVRLAPVDPASTALLGAGRLAATDAAGAEQAFRVAGQFGWREPLTQFYWMLVSFNLGDYPLAAQRLDALLRQNPALTRNADLIEPFENLALARSAMLVRMAERPNWLARYASDVDQLVPGTMVRRSGVLVDLATRGTRLGCDQIAPTVAILGVADEAVLAHRLWRGHCPAATDALVEDGNFSAFRLEVAQSPFRWSAVGDGSTQIGVEPVGKSGGQVLALATAGATTARAIMQLLWAPPGIYALHWTAQADGPGADRISASVACRQAAGTWIDGQPDGRSGGYVARITLDPQCQGHWLELGIRPGPGTVRLNTVSLEPTK